MATNTPKPISSEPITLRVKRGSSVDKLIRMLTEESNSARFVPSTEFSKVATRSVAKILAFVSKSIDNLDFKYDYKAMAATAKYTPITPITTHVPVPVGKDVVVEVPAATAVSAPISAPAPAPATVEDIKWPEMPPVPESDGAKYREPSWFKMMEVMVLNRRHVSLAGAPGTGKDTAVIELAAKYGKPLVFVGGDAGFRRRDLVGSPQISGGHSYFEVAEYAAAAINGWWACISEVNAADADALLFINQQLAAPYVVSFGGKSYPVHPDFRLFITYNPGLIGTKPLPQSFKDRFFSVNIPWFSASQLKSIMSSHGLPADCLWADNLISTALVIHDASERGTIRYQITTRRLKDVIALMNSGVITDLEKAFEMGVVSSIDSPVEAKTVKQLISSCKANWVTSSVGVSTK